MRTCITQLRYRLLLPTALACLAFAGCGSSKQATDNAPVEGEDQKKYDLEYSDVMEFTRGVTGKYKIAGSFQGEHSARITIDGLPKEAAFTDGILAWQPSCELKPQNGQFLRGYMIRRLRISFESLQTDSVVQKPAVLIIHKNGEDSVCED